MQDDRATAELRNSERAARSTSTALPAVHVRTARWQAGRSRAWRLLMFAVLSALLVCLNAPARRAVLHDQQSQQEISRARARLACPSLCTHACERQSHIRMDITRMQTHTHTHTHTHQGRGASEEATILWICETDGSQSPNDMEAHSCQWHQDVLRPCRSCLVSTQGYRQSRCLLKMAAQPKERA